MLLQYLAERFSVRRSVIPVQVAQQWLVGVEPRCWLKENQTVDSVDCPCAGVDGSVVGATDGGGVFFVGIADSEPLFDVVNIA